APTFAASGGSIGFAAIEGEVSVFRNGGSDGTALPSAGGSSAGINGEVEVLRNGCGTLVGSADGIDEVIDDRAGIDGEVCVLRNGGSDGDAFPSVGGSSAGINGEVEVLRNG